MTVDSDPSYNRAVTDNETAITVRTVYTADRIEFHAETCQHRIPRNADVTTSEKTLGFLADVDEESVDLGTQRPVQPCLRKILKAAS